MTPILSRRASLIKLKGYYMKQMERVCSKRIWQYYYDKWNGCSEELAKTIMERRHTA